MKKSKQMVLLFFLHLHQTAQKGGKSTDYASLYANLPVAQSTIRGIVQEFLSEQLIRRSYTGGFEGFVLTSTGVDLCMDLFASLFSPQNPQATIRITKNKKFLEERALYIQLDSHTYYLFENVSRNSRDRKTLQLSVDANQKVVCAFWFQLKAGKESQAIREKVSKLLQQLSRQRQTASPNSRTSLSLQKYILPAIISAARQYESVPEEYYPRELRLSFFLQQLWRARV